jgi:hypothetical protein
MMISNLLTVLPWRGFKKVSHWTQEVSEKYLAEHMKQNPQEIWELLPGAGYLIEGVDQKMQNGELLESEAEEFVQVNTAHAKSEWVWQTSDELLKFIVAFETGKNLDEIVEKIRMGDKKSALLLAGIVAPDPATPEHEALMGIRRLYQDDAVFLAGMEQALEKALDKERPEAHRKSREGTTLTNGRLIEIFFWIKFNEEWLREGLANYDADYEALLDHFGDRNDLPDPDSFRRMLQFLGL